MLYHSIDKMIKQEKPIGVPVYIPTFNNPEYLKLMIKQLEEYGIDQIIISDNWSTYSEMTILLNKLSKKYIVVKKFTNDGPREFYTNKKLFNWLPEKFIVTDPDIGFNKNLPKDFIKVLSEISDLHQLYRTGFALDIEMDGIESIIEDIPFSNSGLTMYQWEQQFYIAEIGKTEHNDPIYAAPIDTTFCLVNKKYHIDHKDPMELQNLCARIGGKFIAQHYGWYKNPPISDIGLDKYLDLLPPQWSFTSNSIKSLRNK